MEITTLVGGCLCGAVRFEIGGAARHLCFCHCHSCRLAGGAPFVAWASVDADRFVLTRGALREHRSSQCVARGFCAECGTSITYAHEGRPDDLDVAIATLDQPNALAPACHVWVSEKLAWVEIGDGLPQFEEFGAV